MSLAVYPAKVMARRIYKAIAECKQSPLSSVPVIGSLKEDLVWWRDNLVGWNGRCTFKSTRAVELHLNCDASGEGWGASFRGLDPSDRAFNAAGKWTAWESKQSINYKELRAMQLALDRFKGKLQHRFVLLKTDSMVASLYFANGGGKVHLLNELVRAIWLWTIDMDVMLQVLWIPRAQNVKADALSKYGLAGADLVFDWVLNAEILPAISAYFGQISLKLCAKDSDGKDIRKAGIRQWPVPHFMSLCSMSWKCSDGIPLLFPYESKIPFVLHRVIEEKLRVILVCYEAEEAAWWGLFVRHALRVMRLDNLVCPIFSCSPSGFVLDSSEGLIAAELVPDAILDL